MDNVLKEEDIKYFNPKDLVNSHFSIVVARRRSGKSVLVEDLINKQFESNKLDSVILFTGTGAGFKNIDKKYRYGENDIHKLDEIIENYQAMNDFNKISDPSNKFKIKTMIVLDDLAMKYKTKEFSEKLCNLSVLGRHHSYHPLSLSFIIITQKINLIPVTCRTNADYIMFNNISSMTELDTVMNENFFLLSSDKDSKKKARNLYSDLVTSEPYLFIICENHRTNIKRYNDYIKKYVVKL